MSDITDPPAMVRPAASEKKSLAKAINELNKKAKHRLRVVMNDYRQIGIKLIRAKEEVGHGFWLSWIYHHLDFSEQTARLYMQIARNWQELKRQCIGDLTGAAKWLSQNHGKETEPPIREIGDEPEAVDESPLEVTTSAGTPSAKGAGERKFSWKVLLSKIDKARRVPSEIVDEHQGERSSDEYRTAVKLLDEVQKIISEWYARVAAPKIYKAPKQRRGA